MTTLNSQRATYGPLPVFSLNKLMTTSEFSEISNSSAEIRVATRPVFLNRVFPTKSYLSGSPLSNLPDRKITHFLLFFSFFLSWYTALITSQGNILRGYLFEFYWNYIITIESFKKKKFEIWCHMMGCNHSSGKHGQGGGGGLCSTYIGHLPC